MIEEKGVSMRVDIVTTLDGCHKGAKTKPTEERGGNVPRRSRDSKYSMRMHISTHTNILYILFP